MNVTPDTASVSAPLLQGEPPSISSADKQADLSQKMITGAAAKVRDDVREMHLKNIQQLTFGGENAEAYFSPDGSQLTFQSTRDGLACDQIFSINVDGTGIKQTSRGTGRTTCSYFTHDASAIIYASTHLAGSECPPKPDMSQSYVWPLYESYDIFKLDLRSGRLTRLTDSPYYDAEATVSPDGSTIIFTSVREGDIDLYSMDLQGNNVRRLTHLPGYDGGAFYSHDGKQIVWRASRPEGPELDTYHDLLARGLVKPSRLDIYVANADGSAVRRLTNNRAANFAPFFLSDDSGVIFASNMDDPKGRNFDLYTIRLDGTELTRITYNDSFDGFPMFSPDGKKLVFGSNRFGNKPGETNLFIADWVP